MNDELQPGEAPAFLRDRGYLPHWERAEALYFVTFRLADSLSQRVLASYDAERQALLAKAQQGGRALAASEKERLDRLYSTRIHKTISIRE